MKNSRRDFVGRKVGAVALSGVARCWARRNKSGSGDERFGADPQSFGKPRARNSQE